VGKSPFGNFLACERWRTRPSIFKDFFFSFQKWIVQVDLFYFRTLVHSWTLMKSCLMKWRWTPLFCKCIGWCQFSAIVHYMKDSRVCRHLNDSQSWCLKCVEGDVKNNNIFQSFDEFYVGRFWGVGNICVHHNHDECKIYKWDPHCS
jgi:hypothetical protein